MMRGYSVVFWDFDGVIKESVEVKSDAFEQLFKPFGQGIATRVREHHERNGGMSRHEKLPLYLEWAGQSRSDEEVARYCARFSEAVRQAVIDSAWVPGAREYLESNFRRQRFILLTATPQFEIEEILEALRIERWFQEVHGAPTAKRRAIAAVLARLECTREEALFVGDSEVDYEAATSAGIDFLLRRTALNRALQRVCASAQCEDFVHG